MKFRTFLKCLNVVIALQKHMTAKHRTRPPLKAAPSRRCVCPICGKSISYRLSVHMRLHSNERPYRCEMCGKSFYQRSSLKSHLSMHSDVKSHSCPECGKSYRLQGMLRIHTQVAHGDHDSFRHECHLCGRRFFVPAMLKDHLLQHSGEARFQCATCGRRFLRQNALLHHERRHTADATTVHRCEVGKYFSL